MYLKALIIFLFMLPASQETPSQQAEKKEAEEIQEDYRVGPADSLAITVFGSDRFDQIIRISNSGKIHVPYLGILRVAGMTTSEIQSDIARKLIELDLIKDPWVQVLVVEHRAHPVYILGEVMQPGQFLIRSDMNIMDLISLAAGFAESASPVGYLYRRVVHNSNEMDVAEDPAKKTADEEAIEINFQQLYDGTHPELNMKLIGGDVLYVPEKPTKYIFVVGDVLASGAIEIPFEREILASQAIAKAGGPSRTAKMSKGMLLRYNQDGERQELAVDFKAILNGKKPDFPMQPDDIIFIPGSAAKTLGYGLLNVVPRIATSIFIIP